MASSRLLNWGIFISIAVAVALAVSHHAQQPLNAPSQPMIRCYSSIRTHDEHQKNARCFTVADGIFTGISSEDAGPDAVHSDGHVIPGLWDGHGHLMEYAQFLHSVDLFGASSLDEVRARIKKYVKENPGAGSKQFWIRGMGWDQSAYGRMPTAADIEQDEELKGTYVLVERIDGHCSWVSQAVLDLLPEEIPDVPGGEVIRDPGLGVFCDNARDMVVPLAPAMDTERKAAALKSAMKQLNSLGLVGIQEAGTVPEHVALYKELADTSDWTLRVYAMIECDARNTFCQKDAVKVSRDDHRLAVRSVKLFADGALGSWGSAMLEPYADHPWTSGSLLINGTSLTDLVETWAGHGFQVNIHAIGDLANRNAIDAFESSLRKECPGREAECQREKFRHRIEHSQIIHRDDQDRMRKLGIIPSIQPTHATSDMAYAEDRLGPKRTAEEAYRMKSFWDLGLVVGSDFPVEPPNPFQGIYAAVTRLNPHTGLAPDGTKNGWYKEEALSLDEALWGFTRGAAYGAFLDGKAGQIKEGALADWVVLDSPIEKLDVEELRTLTVKETWVGGQKVYAHEQK